MKTEQGIFEGSDMHRSKENDRKTGMNILTEAS
jgi:hypothetical protein